MSIGSIFETLSEKAPFSTFSMVTLLTLGMTFLEQLMLFSFMYATNADNGYNDEYQLIRYLTQFYCILNSNSAIGIGPDDYICYDMAHPISSITCYDGRNNTMTNLQPSISTAPISVFTSQPWNPSPFAVWAVLSLPVLAAGILGPITTRFFEFKNQLSFNFFVASFTMLCLMPALIFGLTNRAYYAGAMTAFNRYCNEGYGVFGSNESPFSHYNSDLILAPLNNQGLEFVWISFLILARTYILTIYCGTINNEPSNKSCFSSTAGWLSRACIFLGERLAKIAVENPESLESQKSQESQEDNEVSEPYSCPSFSLSSLFSFKGHQSPGDADVPLLSDDDANTDETAVIGHRMAASRV